MDNQEPQAVVPEEVQPEVVPNLPLFDLFLKEFQPLYGAEDVRFKGLQYLAYQLLSQNRPVGIVETGTVRRPGSWSSDGCTTLVWDWIANQTQGSLLTIDIEPSAVELASKMCSPSTATLCQDSVTALRGLMPRNIDLLFLDSFDFLPGLEIASAMHQLAELAAVWTKLPEGCLIASDDCQGKYGKFMFTNKLLASLGIKPLFEGYVTVWQKQTPVLG